MLQPGDHIRAEGRNGPIEWQREQQRLVQLRDERRQKEKDRNDDHLNDAMAAVAATLEQIRAFEEKLDLYDEAIVKALMENEEKLVAAKAETDALLEQAYIMEDGRRVFRTEDGTKMFDEQGQKIGSEELDADLIGPERPTWEAFDSARTKEDVLVEERQKIIEFQEEVDSARDQIAEGDTSKAELNDLDAELKMLTPPSVRSHLQDAEPVPEMSGEFAKSTSLTPAEPQPGPANDGLQFGE